MGAAIATAGEGGGLTGEGSITTFVLGNGAAALTFGFATGLAVSTGMAVTAGGGGLGATVGVGATAAAVAGGEAVPAS
jgi:hypothetical protein